jgi:uncharacterized protein YcfJ
MRKWFNNNKLYVAGAILGAIAGYLYWQQVGCSSGTCMITSRPLNSTVYGALMGALLLGMFKKENKKQLVKEDEKNERL